MLELIKVSLLNGAIGSVGATVFLFVYYLLRSKL